MTKSLSPRPRAAQAPPQLLRRNTVDTTEVDGQSVLTVTPKNVEHDSEIIYVHGGAYIHDLASFHWGIIGTLLRQTGARITVPLYGLAPEKTAADAYEFLTAVYLNTHAAAVSKPVYLVGDSAGGGLAIGLAIKIRDDELPPPAGLVLFSPWVDVRMQNTEIDAIASHDHVLGVEGLRVAGKYWAGTLPTDHPLVSPINGSLHALPPMTILQGGHDILAPDVQRFATAAVASGTAVSLHVYPAGFHVFVAAPWTPESREAFNVASRAMSSSSNPLARDTRS